MTIREPQGARAEHASQFSTNQSIIAEFEWPLCLQATKRLFAEKFVLSVLTKIPSEKRGFDRPARLLPGSVVFFLNVDMYDEFHELDVLIVLLYM